MKYLVSLIAFLFILSSCGHSQHNHGSHGNHHSTDKQEKIEDIELTKFPTVGFRIVHEEVVPYPVEKVFPLFEPQGRTLLYENWKPTVLREGKGDNLEGYTAFSKYDELDVLLTVREHNPEKGHIQYLVVWDDFEIQRIDIFCTAQGNDKTKVKWVEHNAGLYEKGVPLVSMFVEEGYLVKVVERYVDNVKKKLDKQ